MGDKIQRKFAIILNGDGEPRHLGNVDRAISTLRKEDPQYKILVASPKAPTPSVDQYMTADEANVRSLIQGIKSQVDDDDLVVVYTTGHGGSGSQDEGCLALPSQCLSNSKIEAELKALSYGRRVIVMDQCYSGGALKVFANPRTIMVTQGSPGEEVSCQNFSPYFWDDSVPDDNGDGIVTIEERYAYAIRQGKTATLTQFYNPLDPISLNGQVDQKPAFKPEVLDVNNGEQLKKTLGQLKPGQLALVMFSADWCGACKSYFPHFQELSKEYNGRFLMLRAQGINGSEEEWKSQYGVSEFPTLMFIDFQGGKRVASNRLSPRDDLIHLFENANRRERPMMRATVNPLMGEHISKLLQHMSEGDKETQKNAINALMKGLNDEEDLYSYLDSPDTKIQLQAARALHYVIFSRLKNSDRLLEKLNALVKSSSNEVQAMAVSAIFNLLDYNNISPKIKLSLSENQALELAGKYLTKLEVLAQHPDVAVRAICIKACKNYLFKNFLERSIALLSKALKDSESSNVELSVDTLLNATNRKQIHKRELIPILLKQDPYSGDFLFRMAVTNIHSEGDRMSRTLRTLDLYLVMTLMPATAFHDMSIYRQALASPEKGISAMAYDILLKVGDRSPEMLGYVQKMKQEDPQYADYHQSVYDHLRRQGHYYGIGVTHLRYDAKSHWGAQATHNYRLNQHFGMQSQIGWRADGETHQNSRVHLSTGPTLSDPSSFARDNLDYFSQLDVGVFHSFPQTRTGITLGLGAGIWIHASPNQSLKLGAQLRLDIPFSKKAELGFEVPVSFMSHF